MEVQKYLRHEWVKLFRPNLAGTRLTDIFSTITFVGGKNIPLTHSILTEKQHSFFFNTIFMSIFQFYYLNMIAI